VECVTDLIKLHKTVLEILLELLEFSAADRRTKKQKDIAKLMRPFFFFLHAKDTEDKINRF
jgi:hypothetical protein